MIRGERMRLELLELRYNKICELLIRTGLSTLIDTSELMFNMEEERVFNVNIDIERNPFHRQVFETVKRWNKE